MGTKSTIDYCLLESISSVEDFLRTTFNASSSKLKKYFDKSFLNRQMKARSVLSLPLDFVNDGEINPEYVGPEIKIIYEDELFLVMNKPANIFVHPLGYDEKNNCLSFLRKNFPEYLKINQKSYDRGLLYRLDYETSGVLVYVKEESAYRYLRENFKTTAKKKIYHCLVEGECKLNGTFVHYFSSGEHKGKRVLVSRESDKGERGELYLNPQSYQSQSNSTLMEVELGTGLRHQIRAQLAFLGHPIRGDVFYGGNKAQRLYLNASAYEIRYLEKSYFFKSYPKDFDGL